MNLRNAPKLLLAFVFVVAAVAAANDAGKPITVKGYVLDSACAFTKGSKNP
jgi:type 1 fimbria pilin